jgi:hypothetical protein
MFYTPGELQEIIDSGEIKSGESAKVKIMIMDGMLAQCLKSGDILYWVSPIIGKVKII